MIQARLKSHAFPDPFDCASHSLLKHINSFESLLLHLRYEGKPSIGKNIKNVRIAFGLLGRELEGHFQIEEKLIFPFLKVHVPRLEPAIRMLSSDHDEIKRCTKKLKEKLMRVRYAGEKKTGDWHKDIFEIHTAGKFITYFLKTHLKVEENLIRPAMSRELHSDEAAQLRERAEQIMKGKFLRHESSRR